MAPRHLVDEGKDGFDLLPAGPLGVEVPRPQRHFGLEAGGVEEALQGLNRWHRPPRLVGGQCRSRCAGQSGQTTARQATPPTGLDENGACVHLYYDTRFDLTGVSANSGLDPRQSLKKVDCLWSSSERR